MITLGKTGFCRDDPAETDRVALLWIGIHAQPCRGPLALECDDSGVGRFLPE